MRRSQVLIVEDDKNIAKLLRYNLEKAGYTCTAVITAENAFDVLESQPVDLVLMDVMLPGIDGFDACKRLRQDERYSRLPIILLTAKGEEVDRVVGFELGADDYVVKPFSPRELLLRIKAVLKRGEPEAVAPEAGQVYRVGTLYVDTDRHKVLVNNKAIELTPMEFNLLLVLLKRRGRVQTRERLLQDVWHMDAEVTTRTVDTHIKRLRQKLGRAATSIETVRGLGYRLSEEEDAVAG